MTDFPAHPPLFTPEISPDREPLQIAIARGEWVDDRRAGRKILYKTYRPMDETQGPYPVIIWSHGLGGSRDGAGFISRFIASHGYVVIHIQHHGTDSTLWEGKPGHPWDVIRATHIPRHASLNRFKDVPFALNQLSNLDIAPFMDLSRIGMSGHSFGAMTTQVIAGQKRGHGKRQYCLHDPRITAGIVYSPVPHRQKKNHPPEDFYGNIKIPLMMMTGTDDDNPTVHYGYQDRLEVFTHSGGPDQHLLVLDGGDHMVFSGSRGQLKDNPKRDIHETIIKILSLAFWDAYLKNDTAAKTWLTGDGVTSWLHSEGTYSYKS
ncbi:MAG TPA: hypothetical protein PKI93_07450 [Alphaproteobacteria bacterium]|nr:hypothetical protein [Alphaproteobacteria bacterium]HNS44497.1 hypothetical protein [Alphaproteobacteria bacterium]